MKVGERDEGWWWCLGKISEFTERKKLKMLLQNKAVTAVRAKEENSPWGGLEFTSSYQPRGCAGTGTWLTGRYDPRTVGRVGSERQLLSFPCSPAPPRPPRLPPGRWRGASTTSAGEAGGRWMLLTDGGGRARGRWVRPARRPSRPSGSRQLTVRPPGGGWEGPPPPESRRWVPEPPPRPAWAQRWASGLRCGPQGTLGPGAEAAQIAGICSGLKAAGFPSHFRLTLKTDVT